MRMVAIVVCDGIGVIGDFVVMFLILVSVVNCWQLPFVLVV